MKGWTNCKIKQVRFVASVFTRDCAAVTLVGLCVKLIYLCAAIDNLAISAQGFRRGADRVRKVCAQIYLVFLSLICSSRICGKHRVQTAHRFSLTLASVSLRPRWKDMKVRLRPRRSPISSKSTVTTDAHYHRCRHRRHHCHYRCVRCEDHEIDDLCTSSSILVITSTLFVVSMRCLIYDPPPGTRAMVSGVLGLVT